MLLAGVFLLGFYVVQLKRRAEQTGGRADPRPMAPPIAGTSQPATLFIAYDHDGVVLPRKVSLVLPAERSARAREALRALLAEYVQTPSPHPLAEGADVNNVFVVDELAVVDLSAAVANGHRSGILVESLTVASIVQTLAANVPGIKRVKILIDGAERETLAGHADLISAYDVAAVSQMAERLR
jgi:spore germination protein GerM